MRFHYQNLNEGFRNNSWHEPYLHGRCRLYIGKRTLGLEWAFPKLKCGLGLSEYDGRLVLGVSPLFGSFYISYTPPFGSKLVKFMQDREIGIKVHSGSIWISPFTDTMSYKGADPWWRRGVTIDLGDLMLGKAKYSSHELSETEVNIPMPEKQYPATVKMHLDTWKRRWPFKRQILRATVDIPGGIGHPGKGENSWDCGDDGLYGLTCPCDSVEDAIGKVVTSVLESRRRYGGKHEWKPTEVQTQ